LEKVLAKCRETNRILKSQLKSIDNIHIWKHEFSCGPDHFKDGVHFNETTEERFGNSIKSCLALVTRDKFNWSRLSKSKAV
jgi:hypothetical protein